MTDRSTKQTTDGHEASYKSYISNYNLEKVAGLGIDVLEDLAEDLRLDVVNLEDRRVQRLGKFQLLTKTINYDKEKSSISSNSYS